MKTTTTITGFWKRHSNVRNSVIAAVLAVVTGTLFMSGVGVMMFAPAQTPWTAALAGALMSASAVTGHITLTLIGFWRG